MKIHDTQVAANKTQNKTLQGFENKAIYKKPVVTLSIKNNKNLIIILKFNRDSY